MSRLNQAAARETVGCMASELLPFCWRYWLIRFSSACSSVSIAWSVRDTGQSVVVWAPAEGPGDAIQAAATVAAESRTTLVRLRFMGLLWWLGGASRRTIRSDSGRLR